MSLPLEPRKLFLISPERLREKLERHVPAKLRVASLVDFAHATRSEKGQDLEGSEPGSRGNRHGASASTRLAADYHCERRF